MAVGGHPACFAAPWGKLSACASQTNGITKKKRFNHFRGTGGDFSPTREMHISNV